MSTPNRNTTIFHATCRSIGLRAGFLKRQRRSSRSIGRLAKVLTYPVRRIRQRTTKATTISVVRTIFRFVKRCVNQLVTNVRRNVRPAVRYMNNRLAFRCHNHVRRSIQQIRHASGRILQPLVRVHVIFLNVNCHRRRKITITSPYTTNALSMLNLNEQGQQRGRHKRISGVSTRLRNQHANRRIRITKLTILTFRLLFSLNAIITIRRSHILNNISAFN